eukprot:TRINITY_DN67579_c5_g1_i1.p1 TRINITY_DN67579_c5_g1~~TRINITY_DN67579_c5_g1_i1.p1  ORF type:complete len:601 (-),score=265.06 TRINITY_DN67579_c5_g1_i1:759-2486(-)
MMDDVDGALYRRVMESDDSGSECGDGGGRDAEDGGDGGGQQRQERQTTPLPVRQVALVGVVLFSNTFSELLIFPFLPFMVHDFSPELRKSELGYRAGYIGTAFYVGAFCSNFLWGRAADKWGRKPTMLCGIVGSIVSITLFGLSSSFPMAIGLRVMWGLSNGNLGIAKTVLSEICDDTNSAKGFAVLGVLSGFGRLTGPAVGGWLAKPAERWPNTFAHIDAFVDYPYLLPCLVAAFVGLCGLVATALFLEETHPDFGVHRRQRDGQGRRVFDIELDDLDHSSEEAEEEEEDDDDDDEEEEELEEEQDGNGASRRTNSKVQLLDRIPLRVRRSTAYHEVKSNDDDDADDNDNTPRPRTTLSTLLRDRLVLVSTGMYGLLAFAGLASNEVFPLWVLNEPDNHGFGFDSADIGTMIAFIGPTQIVYQSMAYPRLTKRFGTRRLAIGALALFSATCVIFPFIVLANDVGSRSFSWAALFLCLIVHVNARVTAFTCIFIFIANSAPPAFKGMVNGIGQSQAALGRAIAPVLGGTMFAWSMTNGLSWPLNFHFCWYIFGAVGALTLSLAACCLPDAIQSQR